MKGRALVFRLPLDGWPRATVETDFGLRRATLRVGHEPILSAESRADLEAGVSTIFEGGTLRLFVPGGASDLELTLDGAPVLREDRLSAPTSRSAWIHAIVALAASFFGFVASGFYLLDAEVHADAWALKMAIHMAGWHLLLTLTLFPASVWGQRVGIRSVQVVSFLFFVIHAGIAIANAGDTAGTETTGWIAFFNAASGVFFLAAVVYGQRAHADMDPVVRLESQPPEPSKGARFSSRTCSRAS